MSAWRWVRSSAESWEGDLPESDSDGKNIHLLFDGPSSANTLSADVMEELETLIEELSKERSVEALFLWSAKNDHYIAGADLDEIAGIEDPEEGREKAAQGQRIFDAIERLPYPTFAIIRGTCLGGGLELVLACRYRVAVDAPQTKLGLPEVNLGIIPGFGGTQRLPRLIGLRKGLTTILSGSRLPAKAAASRGIVDVVIPAEGFRRTAMDWSRKILTGGAAAVESKRRRRRGGLMAWLLEGNGIGRGVVARQARQQVLAKTRGHYPAPLRAIEATILGFGESLPAGLEREARFCGDLIATDVSKNLVAIFRASEEARRLSVDVEEGAPEEPESLHVAVLGAGVMGAGVAALLLEKGIATRLRDLAPEALQRGLAQVGSWLQRQAKRRRWSNAERDEKFSRLTYTTEAVGFGSCDVIVEAIIEKLGVKRAALAEIEGQLRDDAVFASNTSALSISAIQSGAKNPARVVGLHFFNPVQRMPLVEVIAGAESADWAVARTVRLSQELGKYPVVVKDSPGFLVNRLLLPYLDSACRLLLSGVDGPTIDKVALRFGLPMGPFRLIDEVGIDIAAEVSTTLHEAFGARAEPAPLLKRLLDAELLGKKGGVGFWRYDDEKSPAWNGAQLGLESATRSMSDEDIVNYLLDRLIDEAARCLEEEVVSGASEVDLAMVMGTGFPAFRRGPLWHAEQQGIDGIVERLEARAKAGESSAPCDLLKRLAAERGSFFDRAAADSPAAAAP